MLLDKLNLHLLVLSEDLTYHFKYMQVMKGKLGIILDDGEGNIDKTKYERNINYRFLNWWKMGLEDVLKQIQADEANSLEEDEQK